MNESLSSKDATLLGDLQIWLKSLRDAVFSGEANITGCMQRQGEALLERLSRATPTQQLSDRIPFNVNDYVWVKLTKVGIDELTRQHFELQRVIQERGGQPDTGPYWMPKGDNGWHRFQLWDLMQTFGHLCVMGCPQPFEAGIEFERPHDNGDCNAKAP